ncbi:nucleotidyltransferase domain-containing protein [Thiospirillum jenense]|uniref:Nucleotidyltransferase domain-containing protein n=1 Tax=Thiospirillum jenense TaxID=1653858 RepID=A0A839HL16_9GAMM|nr:nucleotidyltransferase domain-containing protein [Thiospirillum jenense]MBB1127217.1 nucleotidyltransferase domain-containing protein [Thiospirillum jenense]
MAFGLSDNTLVIVRTILQQYPSIEQAIIYGSRAKGNYRNGSDIDLTLIGSTLDYHTLFDVADAFDDSDIPYTVDVSLFEKINNPDLREHIQRVGQVLYQRDAMLVNETAPLPESV